MSALTRNALRHPRTLALLLIAIVAIGLIIAAFSDLGYLISVAFLTAGLTAGSILLLMQLLLPASSGNAEWLISQAAEGCPVPALIVDSAGTIKHMNKLARHNYGRVQTIDALPLEQSAFVQKPMSDQLHLWSERPADTGFDPADMPVAMLELDETGLIRNANDLCAKVLHHDALQGQNLAELVEGPGRPFQDWLTSVMQGPGSPDREVVPLRNSPNRHIYICLSHVVRSGRPGLLAVVRDATDRHKMDAQFNQSRKMQVIGQLAGGVAHDFNNLLTAIRGHCDLLLLRSTPQSQDHMDLTQINDNVNRAAHLVRQLLAFGRKQTQQPKVLTLEEVLSDISHLLTRLIPEKHELSVTHDPDIWHVRMDQQQLEQVMINLAVNARDAIETSGKIDIQALNLHLDAARDMGCVSLPAGDYVQLCVSDTGHGMTEDQIAKVFEPFYTTKSAGKGTGLGLSMVYGIIKQSSGFIFVDSVPEQGTCVTVYLPRCHDAPDAPDAPAVHDTEKTDVATPEKHAVILLAEDEAPVRAFACRVLTMKGYTVIEAENGDQALSHLADDDALAVDLFLSDVVMPGTSGPDWVRTALKQHPGTPVIFMSGYADDPNVGKSREALNAAFLQKPFSLADLLQTVQSQLELARRSAPERTLS